MNRLVDGLRAAWGRISSPRAAALVLLICLAIQARELVRSEVIRTLPTLAGRLNQPAWERGARSAQGDHFGDYVTFVRGLTTDDSSIVLPPHSIVSPFSSVGLMQMYLFPRKVYNCGSNEVEDCIYRARTPHTAVLGMPHFPPGDLALKYKLYVPFDGRNGLYISPDR